MASAADSPVRLADTAAETDAALALLAGAADRAESAADVGGAIAALRPLFEDVRWLRALARSAVESLTADPFHLFGLTAMTSGALQQLLFFSGPRASISLGTLSQATENRATEPTSHAFVGNRSLLRLLSEDVLDGRLALLTRGGVCRDRPIRIVPGRIFDMDERRRVLWIATPQRQALFLRARVRRSPAPLVRSFGVGEAAPRSIANGDDGLARSLAIIAMLRALDTPPPLDALRTLLPRAHGAQRWALMREMLALDTHAAWPDLAVMASDDTDPIVRSAAARLVARLSSVEPTPCPM